MKPPIIIQCDEVLIFETVSDAERYLEPADVFDKELKAYDSEGRVLELKGVDTKKTEFLGMTAYSGTKVYLESAEPDPTHGEGLKRVLRDLLEQRGVDPIWLGEANLSDLVSLGIEKAGFVK
jgi:hypothetical protein